MKSSRCPQCGAAKGKLEKVNVIGSQKSKIPKDMSLDSRKAEDSKISYSDAAKKSSATIPTKNSLDITSSEGRVKKSSSENKKPKSLSQNPNTKRKIKKTEIFKFDLLEMALRSQQRELNRKKQSHSSQGYLKPKISETKKILRGKVKSAGEAKRRKNRLSSLKKSILEERKIRWWLNHPESKLFPLKVHPALMNFNCVWLENWQDLSIHHDIIEDSILLNDVNESDENLAQDSTEDEDILSPDEDDEPSTTQEIVDPHYGSASYDSTIFSPIFFGSSYGHDSNEQAQEEIHPEKSKKKEMTKAQPLSRPVRGYVNQALSKELDDTIFKMLELLFKYQERVRLDDPVKAKLRRRLVLGLHEVRRGVKARNCICVIISSNVEDLQKLDEKINEIITLCNTPPTIAAELWKPIPIIFVSNKRKLGMCLKKRVSISCVGVYSADGAHEQFKSALKLAKELQEFWEKQTKAELQSKLKPTCKSCHKFVLDIARRDCFRCGFTFCEPCADSMEAKKNPCDSGDGVNICNIVRVSRTLPAWEEPSLSPFAKEFVPSFRKTPAINS